MERWYWAPSEEQQQKEINGWVEREVKFALDWNPPSGLKYEYSTPSDICPGLIGRPNITQRESPDKLPKKLYELYRKMKRSGVQKPHIYCMLHTHVHTICAGLGVPAEEYEETFLHYTPAN